MLLVLVAVIWGSTWAAGRFLSYGLDENNPATLSPATSAWLRYAFAVSLFFVWSFSSRGERSFRFLPPDRESWLFSIWLGLLGTMAYQLLFMHGMSWTAAGDASLIIPMNPVFTALLAVPMLGQKISARMSLGLMIGISGVAVVVGWSPNSEIPLEHRILGDLMILFAALSWAATSNLTKIMLSWGRDYSALEIVVWYSATGWALLSPWVIAENWGSAIPNPSTAEWLTIAYLGVVSTVLSYVLFAKGIEVIGPTAASSYVFLVPVFGVLGGWLLLGEEIGASMILGFALIVVGVTEVQRESERLSDVS
ncbi:MAG: DMT family transporter [Candidatus Thalassarchaeaceae archaeon]|nr:DMT family transporter [Candidatus Thalassarchaeaceae archaeon]